ncbi:DMT family transporter [Iodobacter sp. LRB]|uniref:DMT family transporter n=1 Tax=unclassified Iodobacter TaxID=235634 RepID=UPI000C0EA715|nr:DMT family transporter [Iodobacter sp. BJB302]PHV02623.1 EamA family transporter [Iodobacter sp. BJB302]
MTISAPEVLAFNGSKNLVYIKLAMVSFIWGGTFVAGRYLSGEVAPLLAAFLRFLLASVTLIMIISFKKELIIQLTKAQLLRLLVLGFFGIFSYNLCFFYGLHYISASRASLIVALNPALIALAAFMFRGEKLSVLNIFGVLACVIGAAIVILSKNASVVIPLADAWKGDVFILGCVLSWVIYSVFSKKIVMEIGPVHTVTYSVVAGTFMLLFALLFYGDISMSAIELISRQQVLSLIYLGVIGSACAYIWYYDGIREVGATKAGVFIALNPLSAVVLSCLILGESLSMAMFAGGAIAIVGIYFCNK